MTVCRNFLKRIFFGRSAPEFRIRFFCLVLLFLLQNAVLAGQKQAGMDSTKMEANKDQRKEISMGGADRLTDEQGEYLLKTARNTIQNALLEGTEEETPEADIPSVFEEKRGTFVTLTLGGNLRGCIGHIIAQETLLEGTKINALNAAFRDPRFRPLGKKEWEGVKIEVSVLTDPKPLSYTNAEDLLSKLRPGIDGVILKKGFRQSTFLPQVWEQLPVKEDFLQHLCMKAGLDGNAWRKGDLEVSTYQVQAFEED